ncbi:MAG: transposase [Faecalimonas sp.]|nr:transposase [Faecalimonas sp.]
MPHKVKLSYEERLQLINDYLEGKVGYREAEKIYSKFQFILEQYKYNGPEGLKLSNGKNKNYPPEVKLAAVTEYLSSGLSKYTICAKYKISSIGMFGRWVKVYNEHGDFNNQKNSGGGSYMKKTRKTTYEERILIAKDCIESGNNYGAMALKYNVSYQQVRTWAKRYSELGEVGLEDRRGRRTVSQTPRTVEEELRIKLAQLEHENYMLRVERDLLKKLDELERGNAFRK